MEFGVINVGWQVKAIGVDGALDKGDASATQLRVASVPCLCDTTLGFDEVVRFQCMDGIELALLLELALLSC